MENRIIIQLETLADIFSNAFDQAMQAAVVLPDPARAKQLLKDTQKARESIGAKFRLRLGQKAAALVVSGEDTFLAQMAIINNGKGDFTRAPIGDVAKVEKVKVEIDLDEDEGV